MASLLASAQTWSWSVDDNLVQGYFSQSLRRQLGQRSASLSRRPTGTDAGKEVSVTDPISSGFLPERSRFQSGKPPSGLPNGITTEGFSRTLGAPRRGYERRSRTISVSISSSTVKRAPGSNLSASVLSSSGSLDNAPKVNATSVSHKINTLPSGKVSQTTALKANTFASTLEKGSAAPGHSNAPAVRPGSGSVLLSRLGMFGQISQINDHLFLSGVQPLRPDYLRQRKITSVINATVDEPAMYISGIDCMKIRVEDSPYAHLDAYFDVVADRIKSKKEAGGKVLVHCVAGISRSASLVMVYLMRHEGMSLRDAYWRVKSARPIIRPNIGFWQQMIRYEYRLSGKNTVKLVPSRWGHDVPDVYSDELKLCEPQRDANTIQKSDADGNAKCDTLTSAAALRPSQRIVPITRGVSAVRPTVRTRNRFNSANLRSSLAEL